MFGIDYLGGAQFKASILKNHKEGFSAGFFYKTFGGCFPVVKALSKAGKTPLIRVHAVWDDKHQYVPSSHNKIILECLKKLAKVAKEYPAIQYHFSPLCEHNLNKEDFLNIVKLCNETVECPDNIKFVNCVWRGDLIYNHDNIINEIHGNHDIPTKGKYNYSFDGLDALAVDIEAYKDKYIKNRNVSFFMWSPVMNLKKKADEKVSVETRLNRDFRPTGADIKSLIAITEPRPSEVKVPKSWIVKPVADYTDDWKGGKFLLLAEPEAPSIELGKEVDGKWDCLATLKKVMPKYQEYFRYYSTGFKGYKLEEMAVKKYGTRTLSVKFNGKVRKNALIDTAYRGGKFK